MSMPVPTPPPLTDQQKQHWNMFLDYLQKTGYKGSSSLDNRNMQLGQGLLAKFNQQVPTSTIKYNDIPQIQSELQGYRQNLINQWKAGKLQADVKSADEIMPQLSPVDGWLGSKTSSYKFPTAVATTAAGQPINYGVNIAAYDKDRGLANK